MFAGNLNANREGDPDPTCRFSATYSDHEVRPPISGNQRLLSVYEAGYPCNCR